MNSVLHTIYSAEFAIGAVTGAFLMKLYQWWYCRHLDRIHPLPGGVHRHVPGVNVPMLGVMMAVLSLGYVLFQTTETEERYKGLADRAGRCPTVFQQNIAARSNITAENDRLSVIQRDKLTELDELTGEWIHRLLYPPPHLANTNLNDPGRQGYTITVTRIYEEAASKLRSDISALRDQQSRLAAERAQHPVPDPSC